ncbi:hypothetical protein RVR_P126 (plasmid) [Actinacidiphila reveromycinica]|uniref:Transcriptional regulator n=1 Tax=Actinacidiphila reveromycinica TaxID=659352 RepID=A0A7U3LGB9_9ACTN|nr:hypothetical protein [Streptomyces sp. SN-593]BBG20654.1 hypothetical protein RVR_P126 [Streptomyces sp. SN-593]
MADHAIPNTALRAVREGELQMSRQEFAKAVVDAGMDQGEAVACSARLVAAWEDGTVRAPRPVYRRILTAMTGRSMADLGFRLTSMPSAARTQVLAESGVHRRREALTDGVAAAVSLMPVMGERTATLGRIGVGEVKAVNRAVAAVYAHDHDHGSAALRSGAAQALHTAYWWLQDGSYTERTGRRLRLATGHLSIASGWLSYDSGRPGDARSLYGEALAAARIAEDRALEAHAFGCMALLAKASGRPREAIAAAQGAQSVARTYGSPRMLSLMSMREAGGWALMGDRSATDQAIARAHHLYAKGPGDADPGWLEFFSPGELAGLEALARADLGQHERAAAGAEQAVLLHGAHFARNRALYIGDIAIQHAVRERPEPETAAEAADRALAYLPAVRSDRLLQQLHNMASALQRHAAVPAVADWLEKYRTTTDVS